LNEKCQNRNEKKKGKSNGVFLLEGAHIFVHNKSIVPAYFEGFDVPIGTAANIVIGREYASKQPRPFSSCVDNIEMYASPFMSVFTKNKLAYRQKDCFNYCYQRKVVDTCRCYYLAFPQLTYGVQPCTSFTAYTCAINLFSEFFKSGEVITNCTSECINNKPHTRKM
jgi:hypothetical protein